jgi:hypothetical protein
MSCEVCRTRSFFGFNVQVVVGLFLFVFLLRKKLDARLELKRLYVSSFDFRAGIFGEQLGLLHLRYSQAFCPRHLKIQSLITL